MLDPCSTFFHTGGTEAPPADKQSTRAALLEVQCVALIQAMISLWTLPLNLPR